jgi:hypothetical protein
MYRFKSKADADLIMMTPVGDQILRLIGREPAPQGIIEVDAIGAAIAALEQAIASAEIERGRARDDDDERSGNVAIGIAQRAWPMVEMMRRSLAERAAIVWSV